MFDFSHGLARELENQAMTVSELSKALALPETTVKEYLNGSNQPACSTLIAIAEHLDVSIDYLVGRSACPFITDRIGDAPLDDENYMDMMEQYVMRVPSPFDDV